MTINAASEAPPAVKGDAEREREPFAGPESGPEPPFPIKLQGPVIKGFGRGSKEVSFFFFLFSFEILSAGGIGEGERVCGQGCNEVDVVYYVHTHVGPGQLRAVVEVKLICRSGVSHDCFLLLLWRRKSMSRWRVTYHCVSAEERRGDMLAPSSPVTGRSLSLAKSHSLTLSPARSIPSRVISRPHLYKHTPFLLKPRLALKGNSKG